MKFAVPLRDKFSRVQEAISCISCTAAEEAAGGESNCSSGRRQSFETNADSFSS